MTGLHLSLMVACPTTPGYAGAVPPAFAVQWAVAHTLGAMDSGVVA